MKPILGIDPGKKGGLAILTPDGDCKGVWRMPDTPGEIAKLLTETCLRYNPLVFIEHCQAMPKQGVVSMFKYGQHFGFLQGVVMGLGAPYELVRPQAWKKVVCAGQPKGKQASILVAERLWPNVDLTPGRIRKPLDGLADALCIAEHGRRLVPEVKASGGEPF